MADIPEPTSSFGAFDRPPCHRCGSKTDMTLRQPHPKLGGRYELQSFACPNCGESQTRDADEQGRPPASMA